MGDDYICHDSCEGNNALLTFSLNHLDGQQTSFLSLSVLINNLQEISNSLDQSPPHLVAWPSGLRRWF